MKPALVLALAAALAPLAVRATAAQEPEVALHKHAVYLELGGNASRYSINYERAFNRMHRLRFGGAIWTDGETTSITEVELNFPLMYNVLIGRGAHHLELGAGILFGAVTEPSATSSRGERSWTYWSATGTIGYRHQFPANEWLIRVGFTPIIGLGARENSYPRHGFVPRIGISFGRGFN